MESYSKKLADTAVLAGQIMLECNAESYRVEDTMNFILNSSSFKTCEANAMATGDFITLDDRTIENVTVIKRVKKRSINLDKIAGVNDVSRQIHNHQVDVYTAYDLLEQLQAKESDTFIKNIALMVMCGSFAALFGGGFAEILVAFIVSGFLPIINKIDQSIDLGAFFTNVLALIPMVFLIVSIKTFIWPNLAEGISIIGVIMPLVPGTAITNAIRDTFQGDYNSGAARMLEAFVIALSVSIGVALGLLLSGGII